MKVFKHGDLTKAMAWYHRTPWLCQRCGCEFQTDATDEAAVRKTSHYNEAVANCDCPTCGASVSKADGRDAVDNPPRVRYTRGNVPQ